jgi:diguanylate cyclase (GGDEF)-like protein
MSENKGNGEKELNLTAALRILQQAGKPDPRSLSEDQDLQIQGIIDALCDLSVHDGLTGLVNATFFHAVLSREIHRSVRTGRTCGLMVIDLDYFKQINDTYGHNTGDLALQGVAAQLKHGLRGMDTAARIGGEEFAVILPECTPVDAISAASRIHSVMNPLIIALGETSIRLTASSGLVWTNPSMPVDSTTLLSEADQEMYRAKRAGRGRLCYTSTRPAAISHRERTALLDLRIEENTDGR